MKIKFPTPAAQQTVTPEPVNQNNPAEPAALETTPQPDPTPTPEPANPFAQLSTASSHPSAPAQTSREAAAKALLLSPNESTPTVSDDTLQAEIRAYTEANPLPETPTPSDLLTHNLALLDLTYSHMTLGRDTLSEIHSILRDNPDLGDLLTPQNLGSITKAMESLTANARTKAARNAVSGQKRKATAAKSKPKAKAASDLANFAADLGL